MVDVQELVRWLVDAKIHVAEALPIVSSLAAEGVTSTDDLASLDDDALVKAVKQKSYLKKIRSKIGKGADKKGKKRSGSSQPSGQAKRAKRGGSSDVPKVSPAPECDFSSAQLREIEIKINRSPVIILWATVVAQRLSFDWSESLSIGKAVANWLAQRKGEFYGILEPVEQGVTDATVQEEKDETTKIQRLEMMGEEIVLHQTECGWRAVSNGKLIQPGQVHSHLRKVYGADFGAARQAMIQLVNVLPLSQVEGTLRTQSLYEAFRPDVARGKMGWGQSGTLRLQRLLELRDEIDQEIYSKVEHTEV